MTGARAERRAGLIGTAVAHGMLLVTTIVVAGRAAPPPTVVYAVDLVAAPAPGPAPRRAVEEAPPTRQTETAPPPEAEPVAEPAATPPPPPPERQPPTDEKPLPTRSDVEPLPGETPSTGQDQINFQQEGIRFPYEDYLEKVVTEIRRRWTNPVGPSRLRVDIAFTIQRDGTVTDIHVLRSSGVFTFDLEAQGAVERAAAAKAFGPLPAGYNGASLPISFWFKPQER